MVGKTHMAVGAAAGIGVCAMTGTFSVAAIFAATFAALIPDIDHHNSKITNANFLTKGISWFVRKVLLPVEAFLLNFISRFFKKGGIPFSEATSSHRGPLTHSILGVFLLSLVFLPVYFFVSEQLFTFIVIGMLSHVFIDMFNPEGVPIAYPLSSRKISLLPNKLAVTTGTKRESFVKLGALMASAAMLMFYCNIPLL